MNIIRIIYIIFYYFYITVPSKSMNINPLFFLSLIYLYITKIKMNEQIVLTIISILLCSVLFVLLFSRLYVDNIEEEDVSLPKICM
jgi:positive regulator of sigma E activity